MCLTKTHRLPKISRKPIQVYKVFIHEDDMLITPYQHYACQVGDTITTENSWLRSIFKNKIEGEGVHAFINKYMAKRHTSYFHHIYLCEIPHFTPYWIGTDGEIAASKMIIKEKVEL